MKEPNFKEQTDDAWEQYKDCLITPEEYEEQLSRICHNFDEHLKRNE